MPVFDSNLDELHADTMDETLYPLSVSAVFS